jgi:hypothetical protein
VKKIIFFLLLSTPLLFAGLQYLERSVVDETAFDTGSFTTWSASDDDSTYPDIGFTFSFAGNDYTQVYINSNGVLSFSNSATTYNNVELSDHPDFNIFPYWDDLNPRNGGTIKYGTISSGGSQRFVVTWEGVPHYSNSGSYTFQVVLYDDNSIRFRYDASSDANGSTHPGNGNNNGATIGVREDNAHYDQYAFDSTIDQHKDVLYSPVPPPTNNDYSEYHFDELGWDGTEDEIRDAHWDKHGKGHNIQSVEGKICNGMDLTPDGTDDYAFLDEGILDGATNFTIAVWHKGTSANSKTLLHGAYSGEDNEVSFWFDNSTRFNPEIHEENHQISTSNINNGNWHHLVWRTENKETCIFIDGSKEGCYTYNSLRTLNIEKLVLGQEYDNLNESSFDANQDWEGIIDELLIFRKALTDSEIQTGYNNQNNGKNWDGTNRVCPYPTITKSSCVINDPVNNTSNPKRIPGATIRYTVEVQNPNTTTINDVEAEDNVSSTLDTSTITTPKVASGSCSDCIHLSGSTSGSVSGNTVTVDFDDVSGGTLSSPTTKCGFFEVQIK